MTDIENLYLGIGGRFVTPFAEFRQKLHGIKAFVFDWDGVFNNGYKMSGLGSGFSEVDSMGTNLLRYSHYLKQGSLPVVGLLSGERNDTAFYYAEREAFNYCYHKIPHKIEAFRHLCQKEKLVPSEVAYFFDDVLDIPIAEVCGVRIMISQKINPLFLNHCEHNGLADYISAASGGEFAVRETCELLIAMNGNYDEVLNGRVNNVDSYQKYIALKRKGSPDFFTLNASQIEAQDPRDQKN